MNQIQDRYTGDVGDFGKYGLLKALCGTDFKLGVIWYLVPNENHNNDGKHTAYLKEKNQGKFRPCDSELYDKLKNIVTEGSRKVDSIKEFKVLPENTVYYAKPLTFKDMPGNSLRAIEQRISMRKQWLDEALIATSSCDIVFLDPDNGLDVSSTKPYQSKGPKYVYFNELIPFVNRDQSIVIYQHLSRNGSALEQIEYRLSQISALFKEDLEPWALQYHRGTARAFLIVPNKKHRNLLYSRTEAFLNSPWSKHFNKKEENQ